jgi:rRNA maturation protein Nop10
MTPSPLPPYDPKARCPKCGHDRVGTRWKVAKPEHITETRAAEWLMRHCERCEFNWDEACIEDGPA